MSGKPTPVSATPGADAEDARLTKAFDEYQSELLGALYYMIGNMEDARDAFQEAFIKCWRHRDQIPTIENLKGWIFQVGLNTARDVRATAWRRRRQPLPENEGDLASQGADPQDDLVEKEKLQRLRDAITQLRPEEQEVFLLRQNGDLTYEEIAKATGLPLGTVKTRMRLAITKLKESLGSE